MSQSHDHHIRPNRRWVSEHCGYPTDAEPDLTLVPGTGSGGYGANAAGNSYSRQNQMGADYPDNGAYEDKGDDNEPAGYKTGTSTPGYRHEDDVIGEAAENRMRNQSASFFRIGTGMRGRADT